MNRKGFIATSLIYSFFLVFIAIIAALLNNFIANKNILTRYNEDAQESLNNNKYTVKVVTSGAETNTTTQRGQTLYNLVRDGRFQNLNLWWTKNGTLTTSACNLSSHAIRLTNVYPNSALLQKVTRINKNHKYYLSAEFVQNIDTPVHISLIDNYPLVTQRSSSWIRKSRIFTSTYSETNKDIKVGLNTTASRYSDICITNVMLIDLTEHYDTGNEPTEKWLDENIDYFEDTINFLKEENIKGGESLEVTMVATQNTFTRIDSLVCSSDNGKWQPTSTNLPRVTPHRRADNLWTATLKINNISDDINCTVRWK